MCRSVPQMDATLTFTRTSVRPKPGTFTSLTSAPGAASGLTTASMVSAIHATYKFDAKIATNTKRMILAPGCTAGCRWTSMVAAKSADDLSNLDCLPFPTDHTCDLNHQGGSRPLRL